MDLAKTMSDIQISDGVWYLAQGYIEYAIEVISGRALPDFRDGLKPVQRRLLQIMWRDARKKLVKCGTLAGNTMALSPHSDEAIYQALVLMTDAYNGSFLPLIHGSGNFGSVTSTEAPSASRYPEACLSEYAEDFFRELDGIKSVSNFDATMQEYPVLASSYPYVLVKPTSGIAVGFATNVPGFNFVDVCNLVKEFIQDGKCHTVIMPDYTTGGYYIKNDAELQRLMLSGNGKIKLRGNYKVIDDKTFEITEIPYGQTIQGLLNQIDDDEKPFRYIASAGDSADFHTETGITVNLTQKKKIDETVYLLCKHTDFQTTISANMTVLDKGVPKQMGVWTIIAKWVNWRKDVVRNSYAVKVDELKRSLRQAKAIMALINDRAKCEEFCKIVVKTGKVNGRQYLMDNFTRDEIPIEEADAVASCPLHVYTNGGKYRKIVEDGDALLAEYQGIVNDPAAFISKQMDEFIAKYGAKCQRKTQIIDTDYNFNELSESEQKAATSALASSACSFSVSGAFLKKTPVVLTSGFEKQINGAQSDDVLLMIDNRGRILRVYGKDIQQTKPGEAGVYLPRYFGFDEGDDYKIMYMGLISGQTLTVIYRDGYVGFVDTEEFNTKRVMRVIEQGLNASSSPFIGAIIEDVPQVIMVEDSFGDFAWCDMSTIKRKGRKARTRAFTLYKNDGLERFGTCTMNELLTNPLQTQFNSKLTYASRNKIDTSSFTQLG